MWGLGGREDGGGGEDSGGGEGDVWGHWDSGGGDLWGGGHGGRVGHGSRVGHGGHGGHGGSHGGHGGSADTSGGVWQPVGRAPAESPGAARAHGLCAAWGGARTNVASAARAAPPVAACSGVTIHRAVAAVALSRRALLRRCALAWRRAASQRAASRALLRRVHAAHVTGLWRRWRVAAAARGARAVRVAVARAARATCAPCAARTVTTPGGGGGGGGSGGSGGGSAGPLAAVTGGSGGNSHGVVGAAAATEPIVGGPSNGRSSSGRHGGAPLPPSPSRPSGGLARLAREIELGGGAGCVAGAAAQWRGRMARAARAALLRWAGAAVATRAAQRHQLHGRRAGKCLGSWRTSIDAATELAQTHRARRAVAAWRITAAAISAAAHAWQHACTFAAVRRLRAWREASERMLEAYLLAEAAAAWGRRRGTTRGLAVLRSRAAAWGKAWLAREEDAVRGARQRRRLALRSAVRRWMLRAEVGRLEQIWRESLSLPLLLRRWRAAAAVRCKVRTMWRRGGVTRAAVRARWCTRALAAWWQWVELRAAAQRLGAKAATWLQVWRLGCAVSGWVGECSARREWRVGLLMARRLADVTAQRRGLARWRHDAATRARAAAAEAAALAPWLRRGLCARPLVAVRLNTWRQLTRQVRELNCLHDRLTLRLAGEHLRAWRALTRRRGAVRTNGAASRAALQGARRGALFHVWLGATAARRAAGALALCHFEAVVVACWQAWRGVALTAWRERQQALRKQAALEQQLKADPRRHAATHRAAVRWLLLGGGAAFSAWVAYARSQVWRRGATLTADARWSRGLASRALVGWRQAVWHQELMREARRSLEAAPVKGALELWSVVRRGVACHWHCQQN